MTKRLLIVPLLLLTLALPALPACTVFRPPATTTSPEAAEAARRTEIVHAANVVEAGGKLLEDLQLLEISMVKLTAPDGAPLIPDTLHVQIQQGFKVTAQAIRAGLQSLRTATTTTRPADIVAGLLPHLDGLATSFAKINPIVGATLGAAVAMIQTLLKTQLLPAEAL